MINNSKRLTALALAAALGMMPALAGAEAAADTAVQAETQAGDAQAATGTAPEMTLDENGIPVQTDAIYVNDYAGVLDEASEAYINEHAAELCEQTGAQIVIVTVSDTGDENIEQYCDNLFNTWGIGDGEKKNGLLLLMSINAQDYWCMQGRGLEESLTSGTLKTMLSYDLKPYFAIGEYSTGAREFFKATYDYLAALYSVSTVKAFDAADYPGLEYVPYEPELTKAELG